MSLSILGGTLILGSGNSKVILKNDNDNFTITKNNQTINFNELLSTTNNHQYINIQSINKIPDNYKSIFKKSFSLDLNNEDTPYPLNNNSDISYNINSNGFNNK